MASMSPVTTPKSYVPSPSSSIATHTNTPSKVSGDNDLETTREEDDMEMAMEMIANAIATKGTKGTREPTLEELEKDLLPPLGPLDPLANATSDTDSPWSAFEDDGSVSPHGLS
ncbi:hypothetical protein BG000_001657 [Podila horticola]|nr:hypothetical protein BG000_001657 [Podila horticola]